MLAVVAVVAFASGKACEESLPKLCACKGGNGQEYQGEINRTNEGIQCMDWFFAPNIRYRDLPGNYCRNTSNSKAPWCYTEGSDWAYCDIPECGCDGYDPEICGCEELDMADYRGTLNTTVGGQKCQSWSEQYPNRHYYKPDDPVYADEGLDANYCRNPYMDADKLWCYLADQKGWDYCEPQPCGLTTTTSTTTACKGFDSQLCGCSVNNQADYRGTINVSLDGDECQRWDSQYPNRHIYDPTSSDFANEGLDENYCRNPDGEGAGPWCYLNDIDAGRWKLCDVTPCDASTTTTTSTTTTPCMNFDSDVCGCSDNNMSDYRGTINKSVSGLECQRWDSQVPNKHNYYPSIYPELEENYCRNPEGSERPWCYTTSVYRYDYCDIPACDVTTTTAPTTDTDMTTAPTTNTGFTTAPSTNTTTDTTTTTTTAPDTTTNTTTVPSKTTTMPTDTTTTSTTTDPTTTTSTTTTRTGTETIRIRVAENRRKVTDINATEDDRDASYTISSGEDADLFTVDEETGVLRFKNKPDYENPADQDSDNRYKVTVQATGSGLAVEYRVIAQVVNKNEPPTSVSFGIFEAEWAQDKWATNFYDVAVLNNGTIATAMLNKYNNNASSRARHYIDRSDYVDYRIGNGTAATRVKAIPDGGFAIPTRSAITRDNYYGGIILARSNNSPRTRRDLVVKAGIIKDVDLAVFANGNMGYIYTDSSRGVVYMLLNSNGNIISSPVVIDKDYRGSFINIVSTGSAGRSYITYCNSQCIVILINANGVIKKQFTRKGNYTDLTSLKNGNTGLSWNNTDDEGTIIKFQEMNDRGDLLEKSVVLTLPYSSIDLWRVIELSDGSIGLAFANNDENGSNLYFQVVSKTGELINKPVKLGSSPTVFKRIRIASTDTGHTEINACSSSGCYKGKLDLGTIVTKDSPPGTRVGQFFDVVDPDEGDSWTYEMNGADEAFMVSTDGLLSINDPTLLTDGDNQVEVAVLDQAGAKYIKTVTVHVN